MKVRWSEIAVASAARFIADPDGMRALNAAVAACSPAILVENQFQFGFCPLGGQKSERIIDIHRAATGLQDQALSPSPAH